jgi:hypothetical protein
MLPAPWFGVVTREGGLAGREVAHSVWLEQGPLLASADRFDGSGDAHGLARSPTWIAAEDVSFCRGQLDALRRAYALEPSRGSDWSAARMHITRRRPHQPQVPSNRSGTASTAAPRQAGEASSAGASWAARASRPSSRRGRRRTVVVPLSIRPLGTRRKRSTRGPACRKRGRQRRSPDRRQLVRLTCAHAPGPSARQPNLTLRTRAFIGVLFFLGSPPSSTGFVGPALIPTVPTRTWILLIGRRSTGHGPLRSGPRTALRGCLRSWP